MNVYILYIQWFLEVIEIFDECLWNEIEYRLVIYFEYNIYCWKNEPRFAGRWGVLNVDGWIWLLCWAAIRRFCRCALMTSAILIGRADGVWSSPVESLLLLLMSPREGNSEVDPDCISAASLTLSSWRIVLGDLSISAVKRPEELEPLEVEYKKEVIIFICKKKFHQHSSNGIQHIFQL